KGIKITRQGIKKYADRVVRIPHGEDFTYSITGTVVEVLEEGTDVWAVAGGYASVTPIHLDLTCYPAIEVLKPLELDN
ncbi:MAG: 5'/3'-nucleotidase SurE, partial [Pyramidobacter sp.]|nr:5'/3'-nucleotidase SurE [Pyramidobacter sp.]